MKILVCMKQVPQKDAPLKLNESGTWIRDDVSYEVNEPDAFALEEALQQKEKHARRSRRHHSPGRRGHSRCCGKGLAEGADRVIQWKIMALSAWIAFNMAKAFVAAIKDEKFDLDFYRPAIGRL